MSPVNDDYNIMPQETQEPFKHRVVTVWRSRAGRIAYSLVIPLYSIFTAMYSCGFVFDDYYLHCPYGQYNSSNSYAYHARSYVYSDSLLHEYLKIRAGLAANQFLLHAFVLAPARFYQPLAEIVIRIFGCGSGTLGKWLWYYILLTACNVAIAYMSTYGWIVLFHYWHVTTLAFKCCEILLLTALTTVLATRIFGILTGLSKKLFYLAWK